ncbi:MAG TPA: hypothetical protein VGM62_11605 [Chthoniobacterales bacterium]|jgi:hypothetical protein
MKLLTLTRKTLCIAALLCISALTSKANLVVNPGFETGSFSGWTLVDTSGLSNVGSDPLFAHSGTYHANLGTNPVPPGPSNIGSLSQNLLTSPGSLYNLSFWLANDVDPNLSPVTTFSVFWNGVSVFTLTPNSPAFGYTQFSVANLAAPTGSTPLEFRFQHDNDFFRLDDVAVNAPEAGSTLWMAFPVFAVFGLLHLRQRLKKA